MAKNPLVLDVVGRPRGKVDGLDILPAVAVGRDRQQEELVLFVDISMCF